MKVKKNTNDKRIIDWKSYKKELENKKEFSFFNEYERDLHSMTMKDGLISKTLLCPAYSNVLNEMKAFEISDLDYFRYEKELKFGEFDD